MELSKKVGYVRGLMAGLSIDESTAEGKVLAAMADVLEEMADEIEMVEDAMEGMAEALAEVENIKETLSDMYDGDELDDDDFDDDDDDEFELVDDEDEITLDFGDLKLNGKKVPGS
ncbi:MAG: hypothetical protein K6C68_04025 [Ruminococcus sp.]|nr:hypothetical protein [Ruminococcus sp.]